MAGVKGRSGGARANAGRKVKEAPTLPESGDIAELLKHKDPKVFLLAVMNDAGSDARLRIDAAKALMPFMYAKLGEGGKKEQQAEAAKKVASKFASAAPPRLVAAGGKKL
jgi:phage terminase small subunit